MKTLKINLPIYNIPFSFTSDIKVFNKKMGTKKSNKDFNGLTGCTGSEIIVYVPVVDKGINVPTLCHECYHAVDFIMNLKGIEYHGNNEHVAYLLGYLVNIILEHINNG